MSSSSRYRIDRLRLRHLRLLQLIHRLGSLGAAARELGLSQPAVTLLLRELEEVMQAALVSRDARGARLTRAGRDALDRLGIALAAVDHALAAAAADLPPVLRVGCVQVAGFSLLAQALAALQDDDEGADAGRVQVEEGEALGLLSALSQGALDCVIGWIDETVADSVEIHRLDVEPLGHGRMQVVAAAGHPLARRRAVTAAELAAWPWIVPRPGSRTYAAYQRLFLHNGSAVPPHRVECSSIHTGIHIVAATRMLGIAPERLVERYAGLVRALRGPQLDLGRTQMSFFTLKEAAGFAPVVRLKRALKAARA